MGQPSGAVLRILNVIDAMSDWSGKLVAMLIIPMIGGLTYEVIARYAFNAPTIWAYDVTYMLYGSHFMLGAAYTLGKGGHIRTDFFYANWSPQVQGRVDTISYLLFFFPGIIFFFLAGWEHAYHSWSIREASEVSSWRPPIYPFKMVVPVSALLLLLQGVSEVVKSSYAAFSRKGP